MDELFKSIGAADPQLKRQLNSFWNQLDELSERDEEGYKKVMNNAMKEMTADMYKQEGVKTDPCFCIETSLLIAPISSGSTRFCEKKQTHVQHEAAEWWSDLVINVCTTEKVMAPVEVDEKRNAASEDELMNAELVWSLGKRREKEVKGKKRIYWDIGVHPLVGSVCKKNFAYKSLVSTLLLFEVAAWENHQHQQTDVKEQMAALPGSDGRVSVEAALRLKDHKNQQSRVFPTTSISMKPSPPEFPSCKYKGSTKTELLLVSSESSPGEGKGVAWLEIAGKKMMQTTALLERQGLRKRPTPSTAGGATSASAKPSVAVHSVPLRQEAGEKGKEKKVEAARPPGSTPAAEVIIPSRPGLSAEDVDDDFLICPSGKKGSGSKPVGEEGGEQKEKEKGQEASLDSLMSRLRTSPAPPTRAGGMPLIQELD
uniref:PIH1 N-terminal domain-containing protein n=1 Tax=Chromera velia CCMP2878 TaxID=1169474 RepID=A0A0G4HG68_9ALVE|eukprot:Cvel_6689.t1-p1 / transcript=Cvel_6689.t1 / gene=Cvel_6689 / organism=Chromera_velia_CCMP2878 / gene_product=hypothetical protein / transcript_product=hypothetical protein / location=Cvel_scaffold333:30314-31591(+) / protein_length=426 / sequence_SO=supercontig / SO=protein_coding / is_pseudo=false